ncbi:MAG: NAD-dependent succinate-semialdehyde dehydrogenase [Verrucomicrobiota bacterium]
MKKPNEMLINGDWLPASDGAREDIINPATEQVIDSVPIATDADLEQALAAAERGSSEWRQVDAWTRSALLRKVAGLIRERTDSIAEILTEEQGKPLAESKGELGAAADQFDWYADEARRIYGRMIDGHSREHRLMVIRQPIGPVAAFVPWNFPALLSVRKIAPAIATGCSIIVNPPIEAPRTVLCMAQACQDAGLPPGVLNMVTGSGAHISKKLIESGVIRKVSLTGSIPVGRQILKLCADAMIPASMELGGHSPVIVFEDADVEQTAEICARGKFRNMGQVCISASRFFVQESIVDQFTEHFVKITRELKIGDGKDPETEAGPLANQRRVDSAEALVADAVGKGATLACGGRRPEGFDKGFYYEPTVLSGVEDSMKVMSDEPFGPVAPIASFTDMDDALRKANGTAFGLAGYVFTRDTRRAFLVSEGLEVGMVGVNNLVIATAEAPFGGVKDSGFGREGGSEGIEAYTTTKYINILL